MRICEPTRAEVKRFSLEAEIKLCGTALEKTEIIPDSLGSHE